MKISSKLLKIFLPFSITYSISLFSFAQTGHNDEYEQLQGGLIGGINFSQVDGDGYKGYDKIGFSGGGILYLPLGNDVGLPFDATVALSMEVMYQQKGAYGKGDILNTNIVAQNILLHYAEVPLQINLFRGTRRSNFGMGFAIGYLGFSEENITQDNQTTIKDGYPFHRFDLSYVLTANIHLYHGLFLSPRFEYSLISIRNNNSRFGGRNEQFNNTLSLRLMYLVGLRK